MRKLKLSRRASVIALVVTSLLLVACSEHESEGGPVASSSVGLDGDAKAGAKAIAAVGCGTCHSIPGISGANGMVGPPLDRMGRRIYVAGLLRNTPDNMMTWLRDPQAIVPGNAMPNMDLSEEQARNIAAYLYTLR